MGVFDDGHRAEFTVLGTAMNRLARIEARAKTADLTLAASDEVIRLLGPATRTSLWLSGMPSSECRDTRDMLLFAVGWAEDTAADAAAKEHPFASVA